jgi:NAD(P) transhydrogenase subunit alpha
VEALALSFSDGRRTSIRLKVAAAAFSGDAGPNGWIAKGAGLLAVALASVNIFGGFMVTRRMLAMYKKKERPAK